MSSTSLCSAGSVVEVGEISDGGGGDGADGDGDGDGVASAVAVASARTRTRILAEGLQGAE